MKIKVIFIMTLCLFLISCGEEKKYEFTPGSEYKFMNNNTIRFEEGNMVMFLIMYYDYQINYNNDMIILLDGKKPVYVLSYDKRADMITDMNTKHVYKKVK